MAPGTRVHRESAEAPVARAGANGDAPQTPRLLDRAAILAVDDLPTEVVAVPEWGGAVMVRGLTGAGRDAFELSITADQGGTTENYRAKLVVRCMVDAGGTPLFAGTPADIAALGRKSSAGLQRIYEACKRLSAISVEEVDELAVDLKGDQSAATGSG